MCVLIGGLERIRAGCAPPWSAAALPEPFRNEGTPSSIVAVMITRVLPSSISTLPSALEMKSGMIFTGRKSSAARPSARNAGSSQDPRVSRRELLADSLTTAAAGVNNPHEVALFPVAE